MARHDVDALDERVRRLQAVVEHLDDEHATVRSQIHFLETAVDGTSANDRGSTSIDHPGDAQPSATANVGASDEEVEEAIQSVENNGERVDSDEVDDDILVV